jgi:hypothetical protein
MAKMMIHMDNSLIRPPGTIFTGGPRDLDRANEIGD